MKTYNTVLNRPHSPARARMVEQLQFMVRLVFFALFALSLLGCGGYSINSARVVYHGNVLEALPYRHDVFIVEGADPDTFQPLNRAYGKDRNSVFWKGRIVEGADPDTFELINRTYGKDRNSVFQKMSRIDRAIPQSFTMVGDRYAKDTVNVYFDSEILMGANPADFHLLEDHYASDGHSIFFYGRRLVGADSASFEILGGGWSRDIKGYFYGSKNVPVCDYASFEILKEHERRTLRAVDNACYFYKEHRIPISDRRSLEVLPAYYTKDQDLVFWQEQLVQDADSGSFEAMGFEMGISIGRDKNSCFFGARKEVLDPCDGFLKKRKNFVVVANKLPNQYDFTGVLPNCS